MNRRLPFLILLLLPVLLFAEGSKELSSNGGYRAFLLSQNTANLSFPFPTPGTMKAYVRAGETICAGSSAVGIGAGAIVLRAPDGSIYTSASSTIGLIANRAQELAGPQPNAGGYLPFTRVAGASQEGVWEVDFISPSNGAATGANPIPIPAAAPWTQPSGQYIAAFDVSVRDAANTGFLTGRTFTNIFSGILGTYDVGFNAIFRILTRDGYQYTLDNNGQAGNGFSFFANNKGFRTTTGTASYLSVDNLAAPNIQDPRAADTGTDITHKIFFNTPAADLPATASTPFGSTWLLTAPQAATLGTLTFTGAEGTPGIAGTSPLGANIGFTADRNGTYRVSIDINNNGSYTDVIDRQITGNGVAGQNTVFWDGLDGQGNKVAATPIGSLTVGISVTLFGGEVHFPFFDVERNVNGILLTRINGPSAPENTLYWNDTPITLIVGTPSNPRINLTGLNSTVNGHLWGSPGAGAVDFGDENGIDTWSYIISPPLASTVTFGLREANLQVVSLTAAQTCEGNRLTWVAVARNNGPDAVQSARFAFAFPAAAGNPTVSSTVNTGTVTTSGAAIAANRYTAQLAMSNGGTVTFTFTADISVPAVGGIVNATASLLRQTDFTDPDATLPDAAPPADAQIECDASPSGPGCNNVAVLATSFFAKPNAGPDQRVRRDQQVTLAGNGAGSWRQLGATPQLATLTDPTNPATTVNGLRTLGRYEFIWTNPNGCADTVGIEVTLGTGDIHAPNVITPDGDGKNDVFEVLGLTAFPGSRLFIFNRWGNEVYRSADYKNSWDGGGLAEGTYYYVLDKRESSGTYTTTKGWIFLRRN